jgi:hypothetical protein
MGKSHGYRETSFSPAHPLPITHYQFSMLEIAYMLPRMIFGGKFLGLDFFAILIYSNFAIWRLNS